jgi:PAS domain S-box-containing protein
VSLAYVADGVALLDRDGVVRLLNPAAAEVLGLDADAAVGRRLVDAFPGWQAVLDQTAGRGRTTQTVPVERRGAEAWLAVSAVDFAEGTVYAFRDVTDEHRLEELRADLVATVSHELRTPLASVYGAAMTLQRSELDDALVPTLVRLIGQEAERLRGLVDEILLASRLEAGGAFELEVQRFDAAALARSVVEPLGPQVTLTAAGALPVDGDATRARQVLENLVDNALKYGGDGPVAVRAERAGDRVRLSVSDRGPGVPRRQQARIFEKFFRLDPDLVRGVGGTGLGLYIARELVERMGGRIWVDSDEGRGATFAFELPAANGAFARPGVAEH